MIAEFVGLRLHVPVGAYAPHPAMATVVYQACSWAPRGARLLDVGCGIGSIGLAVARLRPDVSVLGIDINRTALSAAWRNARAHDLAKARFVASDLYSGIRGRLCFDMVLNTLPYEDPKFYDPADLAEIPHAYADDRRVFGTSLYYAPAHAPFLVVFGLAGFKDVLVGLNYEVLSAVPDDEGNVTFACRQR